MKIALAQFAPIKGDLDENILKHERLIKEASKSEARVILFPELSLTGYEPALAAGLGFHSRDPRLHIFNTLSAQHNIIIVAGAPVYEHSKLYIGALLFFPDGKTGTYYKEQLHPGEDEFFSPSKAAAQFPFYDGALQLGICADFTNAEIIARNAARNCKVYLFSALISKSGKTNDFDLLSNIARTHGVTVCLSNFTGESGGYDCAGSSSVWMPDGSLVAQMTTYEEGILVYDIADVSL